MKRWAIVTIVLYGLLLFLLSVPLLMLFGLDKTDAEKGWRWSIGLTDALEVFRTWWFWIALGVFVIAQVAMLVVPVATTEGRPKARRRLLVPVVTAALLLANLFFAGLFAVLVAAMGEEGASKLIEWPAELTAQTAGQLPAANNIITNLGFTPNADFFSVINLIGLFLLFWMLWGLIFFHFAKSDESETLVQRATRWLLRGSILELLIAVPSHIIVRNRNDCCAPFVTFWGIVTGIAVTLLAFGPGVYFLLVARMRKLRPKVTPDRRTDGVPPAIGPQA